MWKNEEREVEFDLIIIKLSLFFTHTVSIVISIKRLLTLYECILWKIIQHLINMYELFKLL